MTKGLTRYFERLDAGDLAKDEIPTAYQLGIIKACRAEIERLTRERDELKAKAEAFDALRFEAHPLAPQSSMVAARFTIGNQGYIAHPGQSIEECTGPIGEAAER